MQHLRRPHWPGELRRVERQALRLHHLHRDRPGTRAATTSSTARGRTRRAPPATLASSRAPICFISMRVCERVGRGRAPGRAARARSSAATKTVAVLPSNALSTFTSLHCGRRARRASPSAVALQLALALQVAVLAREVARVGLLDDAVQRPASSARRARRHGDGAERRAALGLDQHAVVAMEHAGRRGRSRRRRPAGRKRTPTTSGWRLG